MKVLHIISSDLWAGAEVQAYSLVVSSKSIDLHIITFNRGVLAFKLTEAGIPVTIIDESRKSTFCLLTECLLYIRKIHPDVIHVHGFKENLIGGIAAKLSGIKGVVRTHHGKGMIGASSKYDLIERFNALFLTDELIAVSRDLEKYLIDFGIKQKKITVIHNGIKTNNPLSSDKVRELRYKFEIGIHDQIIGTIGRLVAIKNHRMLIEGAKLILEKMPNAMFVIIGDGPLRNELERYAHDIGIASRFCFTGFREDASELINILDIFCLTSFHEGIPMALLEAMGHYKPVVATNVGGISEVIEEGISGLLVPSDDALAFANACSRILEDNDLRTNLSRNAGSRIMKAFSVNFTARLTKDVYMRAMK